jgi:hypothetical protein
VIVDQDERRARPQRVDELEDLRVPLGRHKGADVDDVGGSLGHWQSPSVGQMARTGCAGFATVVPAAGCVADRPTITTRSVFVAKDVLSIYLLRIENAATVRGVAVGRARGGGPERFRQKRMPALPFGDATN